MSEYGLAAVLLVIATWLLLGAHAALVVALLVVLFALLMARR